MGLMDRYTGRTISDKKHVVQSIVDILTTPIGSRVTVRDFGCDLHKLIDLPFNRAWVVVAFAKIVEAITKWEPRFIIGQLAINCSQLSQGVIFLNLSGVYTPTGVLLLLENIELKFK